MDRCAGAAARLPGGDRKDLAIQALARSETVSDLATRHGVSRKFVYQQTHKAVAALDDAFSPALPDSEVLFELTVTKAWLRQVIVGLQNQRDALLAFTGVLDDKLAATAQAHAIAEPLVRDACMLHRLPSTSPAYWQGWNRLRAQIEAKFHALCTAVSRAMADTPRSSSLVENLNSRLRTYFTMRNHLSNSYLDLLRFFLNHRRFMRSRRAERHGKSPRELMTSSGHPHWLTLLGLGPLQP
jgi:hypothetical protein